MNSLPRACLLLGLVGLLGSSARLLAAEEATRTLPAQKCRFTLPRPDWTWIDKQSPNVLFMAGDTKGFIINLSTASASSLVSVDEKFAKGFEKTFYQPGQIEKRGGRFVTFQGLPSYQAEGILADGRTAATRVFIAHGFVYHLTVLGAKEPVEDDPGFDQILQGFDFTTPPVQSAQNTGSGGAQAPTRPDGQEQPTSDYGNALNISVWMGRIAGVCVVGAILLLLFRWVVRKRKPGKT